jgi:hypothetical protein
VTTTLRSSNASVSSTASRSPGPTSLRQQKVVRTYLRRESRRDILYWTLHNGIVISYCRPFTRNKPYGPLDWTEFKTPASEDLHQELLDLRNKCVAHSDHDMRKVFIVPEGSQLFKTNRRNNKLGTAIQNWALPPAKWHEVHELCMDVGGTINLLVEAELRVLYSGLYTPEPFKLGLE